MNGQPSAADRMLDAMLKPFTECLDNNQVPGETEVEAMRAALSKAVTDFKYVLRSYVFISHVAVSYSSREVYLLKLINPAFGGATYTNLEDVKSVCRCIFSSSTCIS